LKIFLNYAPEDRSDADIITAGLTAAGHDVLRDTAGIAGGENWNREAGEAINQSDWFLVLVSPGYGRSIAAVRELKFALEYDKAVLLVLIKKVDPSSLILEGGNYIDISADVAGGVQQILKRVSTRQDVEKTAKPGLFGKADITEEDDTLQATGTVLNVPAALDDGTRIFIAYSRKQRMTAQSLYELLVRNGKAVFYDAKIKAGATWRQTIQKALDDATHLVVIWTPEAAKSDEVEREVSYALSEHKIVVPLLSKEIPKLPYHLHGLHYIVLDDQLPKIEAHLLKAIDQVEADKDIWN
jgi:TIR domain-containing protein